RRAALLRVEHACRGATHLDIRAEQRDFPVLDGTRESRAGRSLRAEPRLERRREHIPRACRLSSGRREPGKEVERAERGRIDQLVSLNFTVMTQNAGGMYGLET